MIDDKYLQSIGLDDKQVSLLKDALHRESRYREILLQEGMDPKAAEVIARGTRLEDVDLDNEDLLRIKIRQQWNLQRKRNV